jgi:hypothetical protein
MGWTWAAAGTVLAALAVVGVTAVVPHLTFGSAEFLAGLAAAALPLLIHLINRRRARVRSFAAVAFLLSSNRRVAQKLKLRQILLLLVRTLLIVCVPLALAKPAYESEEGDLALGPGPSALAIVLDNSLSMAYQVGGETLFERARKRARSVLDDLPREATAVLLLAVPWPAGKGPEPPADLTFDRGQVREALERAAVEPRTADLEAAIRRADGLLALSPLPVKRILVLTDLARHAWPTRVAAPAPIPLMSGAALLVRDLSEGRTLPNRAVVTVEAAPAPDLGPGGHRITARLANFSTAPAPGVPVELRVRGLTVARGFADLPAGGTAEKVFHHRFPTGGLVEGEVAIGPDALPEDDARRFALDVRRPARALIVDGDPRPVPHLDEVFYLERALRLAGSPVSVRVVHADERPETPFAGHDLVFLCNVREISARRASALQRFVAGGGGLFVSLGRQVEPEFYNALLGGVLPRRLRSLRDATYGGGSVVRFARPALSHPVLSIFAGEALDGLVSGEVRRYFHLEPGPDEDVLLRYDDGAPALVKGHHGRGRVLLFTTTIDRDWTDLPIRTAYLPLVQQTARFLAHALETPAAAEVLTGERRSIVLGDEGAEEVLVEGPGGSRLRLAGDAVRGKREILFDRTDARGIYKVTLVRGGRSELAGAFAVNAPPVESDLTKLEPAQVAKLAPKRPDDAAALVSSVGRTLLWPWIALALLAFLLAEGFLVRRA